MDVTVVTVPSSVLDDWIGGAVGAALGADGPASTMTISCLAASTLRLAPSASAKPRSGNKTRPPTCLAGASSFLGSPLTVTVGSSMWKTIWSSTVVTVTCLLLAS